MPVQFYNNNINNKQVQNSVNIGKNNFDNFQEQYKIDQN